MREGARIDFGPPLRVLESAQLGFGAWAVGGSEWGAAGDERERLAAVRRAVERGVTFFDTAPTYGDGESERLLGRALAPHRDVVSIATKVGPRDDPRKSLEASLRRLGTDRVDLVQLHEALEGWEHQLETLHALRDEGKARAVGLCNATHLQLAAALHAGPVVSYQATYNLFDRDVEQRELPFCRAQSVGFLAYRPLAAGLLTGKYTAPPAFAEGDHRRRIYWFRGEEFARRRAVLGRLAGLARDRGTTLAALAIGWVLTRPGVSVVLVGARDATQVDANLAALEHQLDAAAAAKIDAAVGAAFQPVRANADALAQARDWGERERFIVERLDGSRSAEEIAAEWTDRGARAMIAAQVKVFIDQLARQDLVRRDG